MPYSVQDQLSDRLEYVKTVAAEIQSALAALDVADRLYVLERIATADEALRDVLRLLKK